jgi:hypothetical protein
MIALQTRIVELAYSLRESDPELCAWILAAQKAKRPKRRQATRKVRLDGSGKAGTFYAPAKMVEEGIEYAGGMYEVPEFGPQEDGGVKVAHRTAGGVGIIGKERGK